MGLRRRTPDAEYTELDVCLWDRNPSGPSPTIGPFGGGDSAAPTGDDAGTVPAADDAPLARSGEGAASARSAKGSRPAGSRRRLIRVGALAAAGVLVAGLAVNAWAASRPLPEGRLRPVPVGAERWTREVADFVDARAIPLTDAEGRLTGWQDTDYQMWPAGDVVLLNASRREDSPDQATRVHERLFALDAADGHTLWSRESSDLWMRTGPVRVGDLLALVTKDLDDAGSSFHLSILDIRTGETEGERTYEPGVWVSVAAMGTDLAVVTSGPTEAEVARLDPATFKARWTGRVTWSSEAPETDGGYLVEDDMDYYVMVMADDTHAVVEHPHGAAVFAADGTELFTVQGEWVVPLGRGYLGASQIWYWSDAAPTGRIWTPQGRELTAVGGNLSSLRSPQDAGMLLVGTGSETEPALLALDTRHGRVIWRAPKTSMSPVVAGDVVVDVGWPDGLTARGTWDGVERWHRPLDGSRAEDALVFWSVVYPSSVSLYFDGERVLHVGSAEEDGVTSIVSAYDAATGIPVWRLDLPCGQNPRSVVVDGTLVVGGDTGLVALQ